MRDLTEVEYDILNAIYFVEPFEKIKEDVDFPVNIISDSLKFLIQNKLVSAMKWDSHKKVFVRSYIYDADNMNAYHYLITREGLEAHNTR